VRINNVFGNVYSGAIGKSLIASSWKGEEYIRAYTKPRNPRTQAQRAHRSLFAEAVEAWRGLTPEKKKVLDREAVGMSGFNLFISRFIRERQERRPILVVECAEPEAGNVSPILVVQRPVIENAETEADIPFIAMSDSHFTSRDPASANLDGLHGAIIEAMNRRRAMNDTASPSPPRPHGPASPEESSL